MGGGKAGWSIEEWVPLCFRCHEALDGRLGVSEGVREHGEWVRRQVVARAPGWRRRALRAIYEEDIHA
jgi:hypothetical protein